MEVAIDARYEDTWTSTEPGGTPAATASIRVRREDGVTVTIRDMEIDLSW